MRKLSALISRRDSLVRFEILRRVAGWLVPEYRFKWPQMSWWGDASFNEYLERFNELKGLNTDRRWTLSQLMRLVNSVPGDTAECGVYAGAASYLICKINKEAASNQRVHHIFDSFEGLSTPAELDGSHWRAGDLSATVESVLGNLAEFSNVQIHKGWIPDRFHEVGDKKFCFVHIDVDLYQPTLDSVMFFYPRLSEGGVILCDDYGFTTCPGATRAMDQFLKDKVEKMVSLSCGGGFFIKGCTTS